jgi:16S rRNA G966 N2-methylase RsmD
MKTIAPPDLSRLLSLRARSGETGQEMGELREKFQAIKRREAPRVVVAHQLFQTPPSLAARLVDLLGDIRGLCCLEPSAGLGRLADELHARGAVEVVAVDVAPQCCETLSKGRQWLTVHHADFLTLSPDTFGRFDFIAMNPPFTMRADIRHIKHAVSFLLPGGILAGLCMAGSKREQELRPMCKTWEEVPAGTFKESNTGVATILFSIKK